MGEQRMSPAPPARPVFTYEMNRRMPHAVGTLPPPRYSAAAHVARGSCLAHALHRRILPSRRDRRASGVARGAEARVVAANILALYEGPAARAARRFTSPCSVLRHCCGGMIQGWQLMMAARRRYEDGKEAAAPFPPGEA